MGVSGEKEKVDFTDYKSALSARFKLRAVLKPALTRKKSQHNIHSLSANFPPYGPPSIFRGRTS